MRLTWDTRCEHHQTNIELESAVGQGQPITTWRRSTEQERKATGKLWREHKNTARNSVRWRSLDPDICVTCRWSIDDDDDDVDDGGGGSDDDDYDDDGGDGGSDDDDDDDDNGNGDDDDDDDDDDDNNGNWWWWWWWWLWCTRMVFSTAGLSKDNVSVLSFDFGQYLFRTIYQPRKSHVYLTALWRF